MQARALSHVARLPKAKRLDAIAEGLDLLVEHVETLRNDLVCLVEAERPCASAIIADYSEEEAAKVLILLDLVRMGFRNQNAANEQLSRFYSHLARCIYAEVAAMRPASFGEVRSLVDLLRRWGANGPADRRPVWRPAHDRLWASKTIQQRQAAGDHRGAPATWCRDRPSHREMKILTSAAPVRRCAAYQGPAPFLAASR